MWKNNMQAIANIGSLTRPKYVKMPTLDLAGAIDDYYNSKDAATARVDAEAEKQRRQAMVDEMTAQHPEAAARIAVDPAAYANYLDEQQKIQQQFDNSMALQRQRNADAIGLARIKQQLANQAEANAKAQRAAELDEEKLPEGVTLTGNKKYDDAYMQEIGKKAAQKAAAESDLKEMKPALLQAMRRGYDAAQSGTGIGLLGGMAAAWGMNPLPGAGKNYTDIQTANSQMNTFLRNQLAAIGLTGSELNSEAEAEAYRYQIKPTDSESIIKRKLQNFAEDKLGYADFASPIKTVVGNIKTRGTKLNQSGKDWSKVSNEDLMKGL